MTIDSQQTAMDSLGIKQIQLQGSSEVYELGLLNAREGRVAFSKAISILAPVFSTSMDTFQEYNLSMATDEEGEPIDGTGNISFFELSVVLSQQIDKPEFQELMDMLLKNLKKAGGIEFDFDVEFTGRLDDQMKIIEFAFKENLAAPFLRWLKDKGFAKMSTSLQSILGAKSEVLQKEW